jgi:MerR family transcriptional regulator, light-induced transcriptional regulator
MELSGPMSRPARYTIRAVSALTGINPNTLRAWERRYGLVRPERTPSGYRLYTAEDLQRLKDIHSLLEQGLPVGQVAERLGPPRPHDATRYRRRPVEAVTPALAETNSSSEDIEAFRARIRRAALTQDANALNKLFGRAVGLYSVRDAFDQVLLPVVRQLREEASSGDPVRLGATDLLMQFARARVNAVLQGMRPLHQQPQVLCATADGGRLEGDLMQLTLELGLERVSARYVGGDASESELAEATDAKSLKAVVVACDTPEASGAVIGLRQKLRHHPRQPALCVLVPQALLGAAWIAEIGARALPADTASAAQALVGMLTQF